MRIRFILTLFSDLVPAISLVGSAGGIFTMGAVPDTEALGGRGSMGGRETAGALGIGGAGGGVAGMAAAATGGGGGAAATGSGAAAGLAAAGAAPPPAPTLIFNSLVP